MTTQFNIEPLYRARQVRGFDLREELRAYEDLSAQNGHNGHHVILEPAPTPVPEARGHLDERFPQEEYDGSSETEALFAMVRGGPIRAVGPDTRNYTKTRTRTIPMSQLPREVREELTDVLYSNHSEMPEED